MTRADRLVRGMRPGTCRRGCAGGFSLVEAVVGLGILGMVIVVVATLVTTHTRAAGQARARDVATDAATVALESLRGGLVPLASGEVAVSDLVPAPPGTLVVARVEVTAESQPGLYRVRAVGAVRGGLTSAEVELWSRVWRP